MADLEQQLNAILSDPSAMEQIFSLAQSITGAPPAQAESEQTPPSADAPQSTPPFDLSALSGLIQGMSGGGGGPGLLKDLDPQFIQKALSLYTTYSSNDDQRQALLLALRPFLKEERRGQLDRAVQLTRLSRLARIALALWKEQGGTAHV